jgi:anti-sigma regulatory factor (Ser/Thr protein kinase)
MFFAVMLIYYGVFDMKELKIEAKIENFDAVSDFLNAELEAADCSMKLAMQITMAAEEIFVNIAHYAYAPETGEAVIRVRVSDEAVIEFEDCGKAYNPLEKDDPDITLGADERQIGGLGIFMVKKSMDSVNYRYENGKNILTLTKRIR